MKFQRKHGIIFIIAGVLFALAGLVGAMTGGPTIGITNVAVGVVFLEGWMLTRRANKKKGKVL